jgi:hypothetical protein
VPDFSKQQLVEVVVVVIAGDLANEPRVGNEIETKQQERSKTASSSMYRPTNLFVN